jgi:class 3 adenylate cyclase/tetratricopeptide (TPR) repeat protein
MLNGDRREKMSQGAHRQHTSLRGERRHLTVLFSDLVGFTRLSETLDPEDLNDIIDAFEQKCRNSILQFGGYIDGFHGDCVLAFFGYPISQGSEAVRAIQAALSILDSVISLKLPSFCRLQVHAGIATGPTAVHLVQGAPKFAGEVINVAARLQTLARPGEILVSDLTQTYAAGAFEFECRGARHLKGLSQRIPVWRVIPPSSVSGESTRVRGGVDTPFVGRKHEVTLLAERWDQCKRGDGQALVVLGEPGIGKSRLVRKFMEGPALSTLTIRLGCDPQQVHTALFPFIEHLNVIARIHSNEPLDVKLRRVREFRGLPDESDSTIWLTRLLGLDPPLTTLDPREIRKRNIDWLIRYFTDIATVQPLVLVIEDAHWIDPTSAELTLHLAMRLKDARALIVLTSRSPLHKLAQVAETINLNRLTKEETVQLVSHLAGEGTLAHDIVEQIVSRAEGVPLFVEELTLAMCATNRESMRKSPDGGEATAIGSLLPATMQESVLARLDELLSVKRVAQIASVIGHEFDLETLEILLSQHRSGARRDLSTLVRSGLIFPRDTPDRYAFHHAIVRDGTYSSLLKKDKRELHRRVAEILRDRGQLGTNFGPEIIAYHYTEAGLLEEAVEYRIVAARRMLQRAANLEVIGQASAGLKLLARLPDNGTRKDRELTLHLMRGAAFWAVEGFSSAQVEAAFTRARELAEGCHDFGRLFVALRGLFGCYYGRGHLHLALKQAGEVIALAEKTGSRGDMCIGQLHMGQIALWRGKLVEARQCLESALANYDGGEQQARMLSSQIDPAVNAGIHLGWTLWTLGLPDSALAVAEEALSSARRIGQPFGLAMALFWIAVLRLWRGEPEVATTHQKELRGITAEHSISFLAAGATVLEGQALIASGVLERGVDVVLAGLSEFRRLRGGLGWPWAMSLIAEGYRKAERYDDALRTIGEALAATRRNDERHWEAELYRIKGEILLAGPSGDDLGASRALSRALRVSRAQCSKALELRAALSMARLRMRRGQSDEALRIVSSVRDLIREGAATSDVVSADQLLLEIHSRRERSL